MLKNPVHLFRRDGVGMECALFKAKYLPRDPETLKKLNHCVAMRHMLKNNVTEDINNSHSHLMSKSFYEDHHLDFRPEHPFIDGYRIAIINDNSDKLPTINTYCKRLFRKASDEAFVELNANNIDAIFQIKNTVYYADYGLIKEEIIKSINSFNANALKSQKFSSSSETDKGMTAIHLNLLQKSFINKENTLISDFNKINAGILDKNTLISVLFI